MCSKLTVELTSFQNYIDLIIWRRRRRWRWGEGIKIPSRWVPFLPHALNNGGTMRSDDFLILVSCFPTQFLKMRCASWVVGSLIYWQFGLLKKNPQTNHTSYQKTIYLSILSEFVKIRAHRVHWVRFRAFVWMIVSMCGLFDFYQSVHDLDVTSTRQTRYWSICHPLVI